MRIKKKLIFFSCVILITTFLAGLLTLKLYFYFSFNDNELKKTITSLFKKNLNKAVKFENIYVDITGKLVILNFSLSNSNDFNDNMNLIHSDRVIFDINFRDLLSKKIRFNNMKFINPVFTIFKKFGKSYNDTIKNLLIFKRGIENLLAEHGGEFVFILKNGKLVYKEIFKNKKLNIYFNKINGKVKLTENKIIYSIVGKSKLNKSKKIKSGDLNITGEIIIKNRMQSKNIIKINNFDITYFNQYLKKYNLINILFAGGISSNISLNVDKEKITVNGSLETNNLNIISRTKPHFKILSNKKINSNINFEIYKKRGLYKLLHIQLFDDIFKISASGEYLNANKKKNLILKIDTNEIDLYAVSAYFTPVKDITYKGLFKLNGNINFNFNDSRYRDIDLELSLKNFNLNWFTNGIKKSIISDCNLNIISKNKNINIYGSTGSSRSDIKLTGSTLINNWMPLESETEINLESRTIEGDLVLYLTRRLINSFFISAYRDDKKGYELIHFLQTPMSKKLINNNITINYSAENVLFGENANLKKLVLNSEMIKSNIRIKKFSLTGYDASYFMEFHGRFNSDYPFIYSQGYVKNFNLEQFSNDYGDSLNLTGTGFLENEFKLNAFRLSHLLLNSEGHLSAHIINGNIKKSSVQEKINEMLRGNGYNTADLSNIDFNHFSLSFNQRGKHFTFNNFSLSSDKINFTSYGKYNYHKGIDINLHTSIFNINAGKYYSVPFKISGPLLNSTIYIKNKKEAKKIKLFNIH